MASVTTTKATGKTFGITSYADFILAHGKKLTLAQRQKIRDGYVSKQYGTDVTLN